MGERAEARAEAVPAPGGGIDVASSTSAGSTSSVAASVGAVVESPCTSVLSRSPPMVIAAIGCVLFPSTTTARLDAGPLSGRGSSTLLIFCVSRGAAGSAIGAMTGSCSVRTSPAGPRIAAGVYGVRPRPDERGGALADVGAGCTLGSFALGTRTSGGDALDEDALDEDALDGTTRSGARGWIAADGTRRPSK